jgi:hypothetical protein
MTIRARIAMNVNMGIFGKYRHATAENSQIPPI